MAVCEQWIFIYFIKHLIIFIQQIFFFVTLNFAILASGLGFAWPSPVLVKLNNETETVLSRPFTTNEGSWIVSIGSFMSIFVMVPASFLLDSIGRKNTVLIACVPKVVACFLVIFATEVWMILTARAMNGVSDAILFLSVPLYASEVASKEIRGALGTVLQVMCSIGILTMLSMGPFLSYVLLNTIYTVLVVLAIIPIFFIPESPYFLYATGKPKESLKVLTFLHNSELKAKEELKEYAMVNKNDDAKIIDVFKNRIFLKSLGIAMTIAAMSQLIGHNAIAFYLQTILESTQSTVRSDVASVIVGCIQLTASICTVLVTDRFGRKPILASTLTGMTIGMVGLGSFFAVMEAGDITGALNYLPLVSLIVIVFCFNAGIGAVMWGLMAEIFDVRFRSVGLAIALITVYTFSYLTSFFFAPITEKIGASTTYFIFSVTCVLSCLFILFCVPETKGKSFAEIQRIIGAKDVGENLNVKCDVRPKESRKQSP